MKIFLYIVVALLSFCLFLIVLAPAAPLWSLLSEDLLKRAPGLKVLYIDGTIWNGEVGLQYQQIPTSQINWQLDPFLALRQSVDLQLQISGEGHDLGLGVSIIDKAFKINNLHGEIDKHYINTITQPQGLTVSGRLRVENITIETRGKQAQSVEGQLYWSGGEAISNTRQNGTLIFDLPTLEGDFSLANLDNGIDLKLDHQHQAIATFAIKPDGWLNIAVKGRFFALTALPGPAITDLDDSVLEFAEKVF